MNQSLGNGEYFISIQVIQEYLFLKE